MSCQKVIFVIVIFVCSVFYVDAQQTTSLPHSTPEAEGVSSKDLLNFVNAASTGKTEFHSFMLLRHGKVIADGWWNPYKPDIKHTLYSCSKSFTATAVGFALQEKKLSLNDKVIKFFPENLPDSVSQWLSELTVRDVLMMSDGMEPDPSFTVAAADSNWIKGFLSTQIKHEPGTTFLYNSLGTYMLSAIVQKVTGEKVIDYLKPRLFDPLGIYGEDWETDLKGINTGGWGLRLKTEDMAKFAELFLQKGMWNGKQIISKDWIDSASTMKIMQDPNASQSKKDSSDWLQGYCYQMWRCRHNAFRGDGAYGQFMIVLPDEDAVLAITAETADMQDEINLVWQYLLPAFHNEKLPADKVSADRLTATLKSLALPVPSKNNTPGETALDGKVFNLDSNKLHLTQLSLTFSNNVCLADFKTNTSSYKINFNAGSWNLSQTNKPGPSLTSNAIENNKMIYPTKVAAAYTWKDPHTLHLTLRYIESPHTETFVCHFDGNNVTLDEMRSQDYGSSTTTIKGSAQ